MNNSGRIVVILGTRMLFVALLLLSVRGFGQSTADEKEKAKAAAKAKQIASIFEKNATLITFYDREGRITGTAGERALYGETVLSPDGTRVAAVKRDPEAENADLWVLDIGSGKTNQITTSSRDEFVRFPVWSPDGRQLAYVEMRNGSEGVYRRSATGEGPEELLYKNPGIGLNLSDWSPDAHFLSYAKNDDSGGAVYMLPADGSGEREPKEIFRSTLRMFEPRFSPDGRYLSYRSGTGEAWVRPIEGSDGPWQASDGPANRISWRRDSKELYYIGRDGALMAVETATSPKFSASRPKLLFQPPGVPPISMADIGKDGERFLGLPRPPSEPELQQIALFDRKGKIVGKVGSPGEYSGPVFSPDGKRLAVLKIWDGSDIWIFDIATGKGKPVTTDGAFKSGVRWTPDGKSILYTSTRQNYTGVYRRSIDGPSDEELLFQYTPGAGMVLTDISPDGKFLACASGGVLLVVPLTGDPLQRKPIEFVREEFFAGNGRFSPDGRYLAYTSNELDPDRTEIWVSGFDPATGMAAQGKWQLSKDGAAGMGFWRADGKELFYQQFSEPGSGELTLMSVSVQATPAFHTQIPKVLFVLRKTRAENPGDISPDGQRFVFVVNSTAGRPD